MKSLSRVQFFETPWTAAHQAPLSVGFSRREYCQFSSTFRLIEEANKHMANKQKRLNTASLETWGQNHQRSARARSRNRISRAIARMEPSDCGAEREGGQQWDWLCVQPARSLGGARQHLWSSRPALPSSICRFKAWRRAQLTKQMAETLFEHFGQQSV